MPLFLASTSSSSKLALSYKFILLNQERLIIKIHFKLFITSKKTQWLMCQSIFSYCAFFSLNIQISSKKTKYHNNKLIKTNPKKLNQRQMDNFYNLLQSKTKSEQSPVVSKQFTTPNYKFHYFNYHYLKELGDQSIKSNHITINNGLCQRIGDNFKKITQIQVGKKVIILQDHYKIEENDEIMVQNQMNKQESDRYNMDILSSQIVSKPNSKSSISELDVNNRRDKKNIVKNIVKCYISWLKQQINKDSENYLCAQSFQILNEGLNKMKFNNQLIVLIVHNPKLNGSFYNFLSTDAVNRINNSKIIDKKSHIEAVEIYLKSCLNEKTNLLNIKRNQMNQNDD